MADKCILKRMQPKQDMPDSLDQPRTSGRNCFFLFFVFFPSKHLRNCYSEGEKYALDNMELNSNSTGFFCACEGLHSLFLCGFNFDKDH